MPNLKIISWNVNGIRAVVKKGFVQFLKKYQPDILCVQEIKISETARAKEVFDFAGYQEFWHPAIRPGYSGTACLVKDNLKVERLSDLAWDDEGRILILDIGKYYLANIYFPNANHELSRLDFKIKFSDKLLAHLKKLETKKPVIDKFAQEINNLKQEAEENKKKYLRALADYQNLEKRVSEERFELMKMANKNLLIKILPFLDNLEKAEVFVKDQGLKISKDHFLQILKG